MVVFIQEFRKPQDSAPAVWMGSWGSAEPLWRKGCISIWKGSFSCWQMTVRSVFPCSTSHVFGLLLSCSTTGFSSYASPSRALFCCWYMPAKLNFLSQIKCLSNSLKPRKRPASPHQLLLWWVPALHSPTPAQHPRQGCCLGPPPYHWPRRWVRFVIRKKRHLKIRFSPEFNWTSTGQELEQREQTPFISLSASFVLLINKDDISIWKPRRSKSTGHGSTFILKSWYWF